MNWIKVLLVGIAFGKTKNGNDKESINTSCNTEGKIQKNSKSWRLFFESDSSKRCEKLLKILSFFRYYDFQSCLSSDKIFAYPMFVLTLV